MPGYLHFASNTLLCPEVNANEYFHFMLSFGPFPVLNQIWSTQPSGDILVIGITSSQRAIYNH